MPPAWSPPVSLGRYPPATCGTSRRQERPMPEVRGRLRAHRRPDRRRTSDQGSRAPGHVHCRTAASGHVAGRLLRLLRGRFVGRSSRLLPAASPRPTIACRVAENRLEAFAPWFALRMIARLHQVAERHEVPAPAAASLVASPDLRRMVRLNRQRPLPRLLVPTARRGSTASAPRRPTRRISGNSTP